MTRSSENKRSGQNASQTRYFVSNREPGRVTPEQWLIDIRGHWGGVEIRNHWKKDAILLEDKTRSRNPNIVGCLILLRAALLRVFYHLSQNHGSMTAALERLRCEPALALDCVFRKLG